MVEVAGGGDVRPEKADRCASVARPGVVADWKSSKSSSPAVPDSMAANSSAAPGESTRALPFAFDAALGSSPKSKRSCSGSFWILASLLIVLSEAARIAEEAGGREPVVDFTVDAVPLPFSSSSYSSN
jgi:hypothetical protein